MSVRARLLAALCSASTLALLGSGTASAQQSYTWGGTGSTTATPNYNTVTNWSNSTTAPPNFPNQSAIFGATGSSFVIVKGLDPPAETFPDSWTFLADSQSYRIHGADVDFSLAGPTGGLINNANQGQTIRIFNNINDGGGGPIEVQQLGNSTLVLAGANGYSGGTMLSAGTVRITNANSLGDATGIVTFNGGTLQGNGKNIAIGVVNPMQITGNGGTIDANTDQLNFSGNITDATVGVKGALTVMDSSGSPSGVVELSGTNSYSGGTTISNLVTLRADNTSAVGSGTVTLNGGAFQAGADGLVFNNAFVANNVVGGSAIDAFGYALTLTGNISGPGAVTIIDTYGGGNVILDGTNTYTGGTTICSCGTAQLGDATHTGSLVGAITVEGSFSIVNANTSGITSIDNQYQTRFLNATTASNIAITNEYGSELDFDNHSTAGNATINNLYGGATTFGISGGGAPTAGNANITINFGANTAFYGSSTAGNATIVNNSFGGPFDPFEGLAFNNSSTAGNATITTNDGAYTAFYDHSTAGNARLIANGSTSVFDFSDTTGPSGHNQISAGSIEGSGNFYIGVGNTLTVGSNNLSTTVSGVIADSCGCSPGSGSLAKVGTGTLTLSGINTYSGTTTISGGTLEVDGSIADTSAVSVTSGGTLSGTGLVDPPLATTTIMSGGILSPGNAASPTGTLIIGGNLAFQSGAFYLTQLAGAASSSTSVGGTATLGGTVQVKLASGPAVTSYDILHAAGGLGGTTFGALSAPNFNATLSYTTTDVFLNLTSAALGNSTPLNQNQQSVANGLNNFFNNGGTLPPNFASIFGLTGSQLANTLSQLDGEDATGAQKGAFQLMSDFLNLMLDPSSGSGSIGGGGSGTGGGATGFAQERDAALPPEIALAYNSILTKAPPKQTFDQRWTAWGSAFGGASHTDGDPAVGSTNVNASDFGFAGGMDYHLSPDSLVGFSLAGGGTNWSLAQNLGSGRSDSFMAGVYGKTHSGPWYASAALAFANHWFTTDRTSALGDQLQAKFQGQSVGGRLETGYRYGLQSTNYLAGITPYVAVQAQSFHTPGYSEADLTAGGLGLTYNAQNATDTRSELGARFDDLTMLNNLPLILRARLAWAHDWITNPALGAVFQALPGSNFIVNGAAPPKNTALTTLGAELRMTANWSLAGKFDGEFGNGAQTYGGTGTLRYSW